ncbi:MAG: SMC-Scp complex subunit ScpB [Candidatus Diapherotrites archaeon]|nr:SMC-Scp complex subunit ScpB [Candidatus Diapherotrites archaeon]
MNLFPIKLFEKENNAEEKENLTEETEITEKENLIAEKENIDEENKLCEIEKEIELPVSENELTKTLVSETDFTENDSDSIDSEKTNSNNFLEPTEEEILKEKLIENEEEENSKAKNLIEAALFLSPSIVSLNDLSRTSGKPVQFVKVLINQLNHDLEERNSALEIRAEGNGFRLAVKKHLEDTVSHYASSPEMHKGVLKTLALIAFRQPVKQSEIINLRNSKAYDHIRILKEKGFIKKQKQGITYIITTTKKFVDYFGESIKQHEAQGKSAQNALELLSKMKEEDEED